jgi:hypothetical protein
MDSFVFAYIDDFLIFSKTLDEHKQHLDAVLSRLQLNGFFLNREKCNLGKSKILYLGHEISSKGIRPLNEKIELYTRLKPPKNVKELRSFLGIVNYYREHCKHFSEILAPLNKLLSGLTSSKKSTPIPWGNNHQEAFDATIKALREADTLSFDQVEQPLVLTTDASATHAGAVLEQFIDDNYATTGRMETRPIAYFSQAFPSITKARSTFNRELTALYLAVRHFRFRIRGRDLIFRTDHKSLVNAMSNPEGQHSPEERRMIYHLKEYLPTLMYLSGDKNVIADLLSRPEHYNRNVSTQTGDVTEVKLTTEEDSIQPYNLTVSLIAHEQNRDDLVSSREKLEASLPAGEKLITKSLLSDDEQHGPHN